MDQEMIDRKTNHLDEVEKQVNYEQSENTNLLLSSFSSSFKDIQMMKARVQLENRTPNSKYYVTKKITDFQLLTNNKKQAIDLLLESQPNNSQSFFDSLKACIVAATIDTETFHNTVKLVATNLIANDQLRSGVQLLCLIGKTKDACRYLQSYDQWYEAAWLAKVIFTYYLFHNYMF